MSLSKFLMAHDAPALEALTSKGLVRRAQRDLESGLAQVTLRESASATVAADGETVSVDARGIAYCRCSCPAGGKCRHILLAILALRGPPSIIPLGESADAAASAAAHDLAAQVSVPPTAHSPSMEHASLGAIPLLTELSEASLQKFAGSAWLQAVTLAAESADARIVEEGRNCRVEFSTPASSVTFIAGQPLKGAAYKGPKTRQRVMVTAAAILVRSRHGAPVGMSAVDESPAAAVGGAFLDSAGEAVLSLVRSVLTGPSQLLLDAIFDLAISARAEAAPRLAGQLRALAEDAGRAMRRDVSFEPAHFVAVAANTVALIQALRANPLDPSFTGSLRRIYKPRAGDLQLWMMAASCWRTDSGARGITFHAFAPGEKAWYSATIARGAGQDPTFDPRVAYLQPLWGAGQPTVLMARQITLPVPLVAVDRSIAITQESRAVAGSRAAGIAELAEAGVAHRRWIELRSDLARRVGDGLSRRLQPLPVVLCPAQFRGLSFDEIAQVYQLEVIDHEGEALLLTLPADSASIAERLRSEGNRIRFVCAEATLARGESLLRPIAIGLEVAGELSVVNLELDHWPQQGLAQAALGRLRDALSLPRASKKTVDPLRKIALCSLDAAANVASAAPPVDLSPLIADCDAAGLLTLARSLERLAARSNVPNALRTAYLATEVEAAAAWD